MTNGGNAARAVPPRPSSPSGTRPCVRFRQDPPAAGELIAERYVIERVVAEGGFGIVVAAMHVELEERVAIKFLKPEVAHVPDVVARFAREAKACASIRSEHVPTVHDVGVSRERGPFIVMEYLEGEDLLAVLKRRGPLPVAYATELLLQACEAIAAAHAKGIVHRDIKPENLFVARSAHGIEMLKVLDFGISKAVLTGEVFGTKLSLLKTQNLVGTPMYMSPEQLRGKGEVGPRSDVWSLGAVLYELVTARTAFGGMSVTEVCATILEAEPQPPAELRGDLPAGFADVVMRCLEKDPAKRFGGVAELAHALAPFAPERARAGVERTIAMARSAGLACPAEPEPMPVPVPIGEEPIEPEPIEPEPIADAASREADTTRSLRVVAAAAALAGVAIVVLGNGLLGGGAAAERNGITVRDTPADDDDNDALVSTPVLRLPIPPAPAAPVIAAPSIVTATGAAKATAPMAGESETAAATALGAPAAAAAPTTELAPASDSPAIDDAL